MDILGWAMAVMIGLTLGLLGGGGSILAVPVMVYMLGINPVTSTGYSLFIVGISALFGTFSYLKKKLIDLKIVASFGGASIFAVYVARRVIVPNIPLELLEISGHVLTRNMAIMLLFAVLMLAASYSMITSGRPTRESQVLAQYNYVSLIVQGAVIGILVGLVGAGGGFLIIPALVIFSKLPMKAAIGTSLSIIAVNSLVGFLGDVQTRTMNWDFLLGFAALAVVGMYLGTKLSARISGDKLKPAFGWFVLAMGLYIVGTELLF